MQPVHRGQPKVLIVDDDMILASIYRKKFQDARFQVDVAGSGETALLKISQDVPDVILLDLMLGDMNGVEILEALRMNETTHKLPVVVFSNVFLGDLMDKAARAGATKCLSKSGCPPYRVIEEVQAALARGHTSNETLVPTSPSSRPGPSMPGQSTTRTIPTPSAAVAPNAAPAKPASAALLDQDLPENVRRDLLEQLLRRIEEVEKTLPKWITNAHNLDAPYLPALYRSIRSIAGSAGLVGCLRLGQLAGVLEALLKDLKATRGAITPSLLRTVAQAAELLPALARQTDTAHADANAVPLILVAGSTPEAYGGLCTALESAHLRAIGVDDAFLALKLFSTNRFDLVVIDVEGDTTLALELATELHASPSNQETPVIFVLSGDGLEASVQANGIANTDSITKPLIPLELGVKSLTHLQRPQVPVMV